MKNPSTAKLIRNFSLLCLILALGSLIARADIASVPASITERKGPASGAMFSNPGLAQSSPAVKIAMREASVKIFLEKGAGPTLTADCEAIFELMNLAPAEVGPQEFLVAFPVTGLNSKIVTIDNFAVTVDGRTPPTVFRQGISISKNQKGLRDAIVARKLAEPFTSASTQKTSVELSNETAYPNAYMWSQQTAPTTKCIVRVTYTATLRPQRVNTANPYSGPRNLEMVPQENLNLNAIDDSYYFFDYVLLSGATWEGPIGHETIALSVAPELHLDPIKIVCARRTQVGLSPHATKQTPATPASEGRVEDGSVVIELKAEKPNYDLLFTIPMRAIGQYQPEKK